MLAIFLKIFGVDSKRFWRALRNTGRFIRDYRAFRSEFVDASQVAKRNFAPRAHLLLPYLHDFDDTAGALGVYFHQDLWAARKIYGRRPKDHVDMGSRIDGFIAHLLVFMTVSVVDVRDMKCAVPGMEFVKADAANMDLYAPGSVDSLSSLHVAEHIGLGRYGDPIDPDGCFIFMRNLSQILKVGGRLYFSVPIGAERLHFNAHRVFSPMTILDAFDGLKLESFSAVTRHDSLAEDVNPEDYLTGGYKVGLFEFTKQV